MTRPSMESGVRRGKIEPIYLKPNDLHGCLQVCGNLGPFFALLAAVRAADAYWLIVLLVLAIGIASHRLFFPLHDCIHYTLFRSKFINAACGHFLSALLGTTFTAIRSQHLLHHRDFADTGGSGRRGLFRPLPLAARADFLPAGSPCWRNLFRQGLELCVADTWKIGSQYAVGPWNRNESHEHAPRAWSLSLRFNAACCGSSVAGASSRNSVLWGLCLDTGGHCFPVSESIANVSRTRLRRL